jgi:uncharacterized protein (TIGR02996 family)
MPHKKSSTSARDKERATFLAAIRAHPEDDTARLVFADWLEEHGDADRAEFIRLGCQHARLEEDDPQYSPLENRLWELLDKHALEWREEAPPWVRTGMKFRRGFVDGIVTSATLWIKRADKLLKIVPLTSARLENVRELLPELLAAPSLARLSRLSLGWNDLNGAVKTLVSSRALANLRSLELNLARLDDEDMKALATARHLAGLTALNLDYNRIREKGALALAKSRHLVRLTKLELCENRIGDKGLRALAGSPVLAPVRYLELYGNGIGDAGAIALASSSQTGSLRKLALGGNNIGNPGISALAKSPHLAGLKQLYLHANAFGEAGALALAASPHLDALGDLAVEGATITPTAANALRERFGECVRW